MSLIDVDNQAEITLNSGKVVKVKLPPMTLAVMDQVERTVLKKALVNPELLAVLSLDETKELYLRISDLNMKYWAEYAKVIMHG